jgi:hypothetical protein
MSPFVKSPLLSRRIVLGLLAAFTAFPGSVLAAHRAAADEFVLVNGWVLKRSDLGPRGGR